MTNFLSVSLHPPVRNNSFPQTIELGELTEAGKRTLASIESVEVLGSIFSIISSPSRLPREP